MGGMQIQMQKRRPFSSLLLGAAGKRGTGKGVQPRQIPQNGRKVACEVATEHAVDTLSDHDTDSQLDELEGGNFLPEKTPPALEPSTSERSTSHPLKGCRVNPKSIPSAAEEDSATGSPTSATKGNDMMASVESQDMSHSGESSSSPGQCPIEEPRSDDDAATATGCSLLDLWANPSTCEHSAKRTTSSSLTASKIVRLHTPQTPNCGPEAPEQVSTAPKVSPVQHTQGAKRPRVSITLGRVSSSPLGKKRALSTGQAQVLRPSHVQQRQVEGVKSATFKEICGGAEAPPAYHGSTTAPPGFSTSHNLTSSKMMAGDVPSRTETPSAGFELHRHSNKVPPPVAIAPSAVVSAPSDDLPMSVRMDRDIINTMLVTRRTSSRWSEYARDGAPWTLEEEAWLVRHHKEGGSLVWLSEQLSRTRSAVKARLKRRC